MRISDCDIETGDDCIIVRANSASLRENRPCERVSVSRCRLRSYSSAIRVGWVNDGDIFFKGCRFELDPAGKAAYRNGGDVGFAACQRFEGRKHGANVANMNGLELGGRQWAPI